MGFLFYITIKELEIAQDFINNKQQAIPAHSLLQELTVHDVAQSAIGLELHIHHQAPTVATRQNETTYQHP